MGSDRPRSLKVVTEQRSLRRARQSEGPRYRQVVSARAFRPCANCSKLGPRSGIERQISGSSGPVYSSRMVKRVAAPSAASVNVRTPLKSPSGMPPLQTIRSPGANSVTLTGKARFGLASETTLIFSCGAIVPSTRITPESQRAYRGRR